MIDPPQMLPDKHCKCCNYPVVVISCPPQFIYDYWYYCSNKMCENHKGTMTQDDDMPDWIK